MHICFVALTAYPVLNPKIGVNLIGGAELQQVQIAKLLLSEGYQVSFITLDYGQEDGEIIDGIKIFKTYKVNDGLPGLRFFYPRFTKLIQTLAKVDADLYYTRAAGVVSGFLALYSLVNKRVRYVYAGASDADFMPDKLLIKFKRDKFLYEAGLRRANAVICQSETQKQLLKNNYKIDGVVIPNFFNESCIDIPEKQRNKILWVGKVRELRQPHLYLDLAEKFPNLDFVMIGGPDASDPDLYKSVETRASKIINVFFLGFQPFEITEQYFDQCKFLINTSRVEGFPNTFLQAMRRGIPIISFVDPGRMVALNGLGVIAKDFSGLEDAVRGASLKTDFDLEAIKNFYSMNFSKSSAILNYQNLFEKICY